MSEISQRKPSVHNLTTITMVGYIGSVSMDFTLKLQSDDKMKSLYVVKYSIHTEVYLNRENKS